MTTVDRPCPHCGEQVVVELSALPLRLHDDPEAALRQALAELSMDVTAWLRDALANGSGGGAAWAELWPAASPQQVAATVVASLLAQAATPDGEDPWLTAVAELTPFVVAWHPPSGSTSSGPTE